MRKYDDDGSTEKGQWEKIINYKYLNLERIIFKVNQETKAKKVKNFDIKNETQFYEARLIF